MREFSPAARIEYSYDHYGGPVKTVTSLLIEWRGGNAQALDQMIPLVYDELRGMARIRLAGERSRNGMPATALVHEVYVRLIDARALPANSREHFLALASRLMRQILVDEARRRRALKRGAQECEFEIGATEVAAPASTVDILALDQSLEELAALDQRQRDIVVMKFFGGLTISEIAKALEVSHATVERDWAMAKAFLFSRLRS